ncbi:MAG TPA: fluoride efflux transporter CrcB [Pyrinomonadaceae bacterium]|nr:fluoride efflux transporter CrcB [Pyrinomonadaceae bacterium]
MVRSILIVGLGGFLGSIVRYLAALLFSHLNITYFPFATLSVNIVGCLLIGILFGLGERGQLLSPEMRIFLTTGFCGGLTTFSTFSYENIQLLQDGQFFYFGMNLVFSIVLGLAATYLGIQIVRLI